MSKSPLILLYMLVKYENKHIELLALFINVCWSGKEKKGETKNKTIRHRKFKNKEVHYIQFNV